MLVTSIGSPGVAAAATPLSADQAASVQAAASGLPVTVPADTTEFSQNVANPDGSFTLTTTTQPQRARRGNAWVPVDATLTANADGTLSPAAAAAGLKLSGGGAGALATLDDGAGHILSVSMPMTLPTPTLSGDTALYASVLPGVDLSATATITGGIREILIVRDAAAAANPALSSLRLATTTTGLTLATDTRGAITATDPTTGQVVLSAAPPTMWDSTGTAQAARTQQLTDGITVGVNAAGDPVASSTAGPGANATIAAIPTALSVGAITLTPPAAMLTAKTATFPEYIDPGFNYTRGAYAYVESFHTTTTAYMPTDNLRVGFDDWSTNCGSPCWKNGITRAYMKFENATPMDGKTIINSALTLSQTGASCPNKSFDIRAAVTAGAANFDATLDWANQSGASGVVDHMTMDATDGSKTMTVNTITSYAAAHNYGYIPIVIWAGDETDDCAYRHFGLNQTLSVTYESIPNAPASLAEKNGTASYACTTTSPGTWIPKAVADQITLNDTVSTPDAGAALTANMYLSSNGGSTYVNHTGSASEDTANHQVAASTSVTLADGTAYRWYATTKGATLTSLATPTGAPGSAACYFRYDGTTPSTPGVTSTAYPVNGPTTVTVGGSGNLTLSSADGGVNPSGVASFKYDIDGTGITTGGVQGTIAATAGSATLSVALSQLHWGTNTVYVQAVDVAGNLSGVTLYNFYAQQSAFGPYAPGTAGDINADNIPDLVTVTATGDIQLYANPTPGSADPTGDLTADPHQYGGRILMNASDNARWGDPDSASAAGAIIAHAGSFTGHNYDDLLVLQNGHLGLAVNPGTSAPWTFASGTYDISKPTCASGDCANYNATDWSAVTQMIAIPAAAPSGPPSLLTVETINGKTDVWLYAPAGGFTFHSPVQLSNNYSNWNWDRLQLTNANPLPGITGTALVARDLGNGGLYVIANATAMQPNTSAPAPTVIGTGFTRTGYPLLSASRADANGRWSVWAADYLGGLWMYPATTTAGNTNFQNRVALSTTGNWTSHQLALNGNYVPHNNVGAVIDGDTGGEGFDTTTANAYGTTALANATPDNGAQFFCAPNDNPATCATGIAPNYAIQTTNTVTGGNNIYWIPNLTAGQYNNFQASGQTIPAPTPNTSGPAHTISFLGAGVGGGTNGATVTATITYTDGGTQNITITLPDWGLDTDTTPVAGATCILISTYRVTTTTGAKVNTTTRMFTTPDTNLLNHGVALTTGVQIASITLGSNSSVHIITSAIG